MDLVILKKLNLLTLHFNFKLLTLNFKSFNFKLTFFRSKHFLIDHYTGSKFKINRNNKLAILMMLRPKNYNFGSRRPQV